MFGEHCGKGIHAFADFKDDYLLCAGYPILGLQESPAHIREAVVVSALKKSSREPCKADGFPDWLHRIKIPHPLSRPHCPGAGL